MSIADTAPANPIPGQLWWRSSDGASFLWFDDGTSKQWVGFNISTTLRPAFIQQQVITATGAITLHVDTKAFLVEVQGGGAGGGAGTASASQGAAAGGGGAGGYCSKWIIRPTGTFTPTCTVAAAGGAGSNGNASSYTDGTNTLTASGGGAGANAASSTTIGASSGGAGGAASGGDINVIGDPGFWGDVISIGTTIKATGGRGGSSRFGPGANTIVGTSVAAYKQDGAIGGRGAGGSGAISINGGGTGGGNLGSAGLVIVTEYR
jgi:hypothetical protein